ncbi:ATP-binding cassette domain-containing protein [Undibacterium sp. TS12]|uniref:ABC transporter ATP-binding protein n=1 Tax=Undibacterium sp. TS12 TaxID=2908202 RepID=UPI001F4D2421|nr:ATP-binding cassette domain-containing protein [Undibacterium sp. TS12]MCH8617891.1 ATP-binding cassette domain-containing protein [Undibacterium sp. TS12]
MNTERPAILEVDNLSFGYGDAPLFQDWSARIQPGITLVRGGDGRGKSSLLQLFAGMLPAQAGQLRLQGVTLHEQPERYAREVFWIDPRTENFDQMSVPEYFASLPASYPDFDASLLPALTEGLGLTPHLHKQLFMLSTGSKRKVWLAAAFAANARLTLLDDPFSALDKTSIQFVVQTLGQYAGDPARAWVLAMYEEPAGIPLSALFDLGD